MQIPIKNDGGIYSLSGFAFQIRVFFLHLASLDYGKQIGFETLDDIGIQNFCVDNINKYCDRAISVKQTKSGVSEAIQVKCTQVTTTSFIKILYNWLIIENSNPEIGQFTLVTDRKHKPPAELFPNNIESLYNDIINSSNDESALITKVKLIYDKKETEFKVAFDKIKEGYKQISYDNVDDEIRVGFSKFLLRPNVTETTYNLRVKELLSHFTAEIIESANKREPFVCSFENLCRQVEDTIKNINDDKYLPQFSQYMKLHRIDFGCLEIASSRECKQLESCSKKRSFIEKFLMYKSYYEDYKYRNLGNNKVDLIDNIEQMSFDNFSMEKEKLQLYGNDIPFNRLDGTIQRSNMYAENDPIRLGSAIHLTKESTPFEILISWEDADNAAK